MNAGIPRVYADTSVYGGVFDPEFSKPSRRFFDQVRQGRFYLVVSPVVLSELVEAPEEIRGLLDEVLAHAEALTETDSALRLMAACLKSNIVSEKFQADALHVATATTSGCHAIVSWNFKHIVHFKGIPLY